MKKLKWAPWKWPHQKFFVKNQLYGILLVVILFSSGYALPPLKSSDAEKLLTLPFGIKSQQSLILRSRHVDSILFLGAAHASDEGFYMHTGTTEKGLWLELKNEGSEGWASAVINFTENTDASRYNSLILWVRASGQKKKIYLSLRDYSMEVSERAPRTSVYPPSGFPPYEWVQLVVPFQAFSGAQKIDLSRLSRLTIEFGSRTTGNTQPGEIVIGGIGFVQQQKRFSNVLVIGSNAQLLYPKSRVKSYYTQNREAADLFSSATLDEISDDEFDSLSNNIKAESELKKAISPQRKEISEKKENNAIKPSIRKILAQSQINNVVSDGMNAAKIELEKNWIYYGLLVLLFFIGIALYIDRKRQNPLEPFARKIIHKIVWPFLVTDMGKKASKAEKQFWKKLGSRGISLAWISPYSAPLEVKASDEHYGESFLLRQIELAKQGGVTLLPSVCFARTLFHYDSFLSNPSVYYSKPIPTNELHLSDEELRVNHLGFFPVWIPPQFQRKHRLPQRLLLCFGKLPGTVSTHDSVQFNLRSNALRAMAKRVLCRIAEKSPGVRIEGAASHLNVSLNIYWKGHFENSSTPLPQTEFWTEVIKFVKEKYPSFVFVADGIGGYSSELRRVGFDMVEGRQMSEIIINQIRLEEVGLVGKSLDETKDNLPHYIFDISPYLRGVTPTSVVRQQNMLACLLMGLFPGMVQHDGQVPQEFQRYCRLISQYAVFKNGRFVLLDTGSNEFLAFARLNGKQAFIAVANFSMSKKQCTVRIDSIVARINPQNLYFFSDVLHGVSVLNSGRGNAEPALAVLGQDLLDGGFTVSLSELSLRLFSVNLGHSSSNATISKVRQFHKT